jgi:hypothetical protein
VVTPVVSARSEASVDLDERLLVPLTCLSSVRVCRQGNHLGGLAVHIAARVESLAARGEVS